MSDMRVFWAGLALTFLASCGTEVAPRQEGVGFGNYDEYLEARERDQQAAAQGIVPGMVVSPESTAAASDIGSPTAEDQQSAPVVDTLAMETAAVWTRLSKIRTSPSQITQISLTNRILMPFLRGKALKVMLNG